MKRVIVILGIVATMAGFSTIMENSKPVPIPASVQRGGGDPQKGYEYLVNGDYVRGGLPRNLFKMGIGKVPVYLKRDSINKDIPHDFTAIHADNGEVIVAPNCLQCHAQVFNDSLVIGLGNTRIDFSDKKIMNEKKLRNAERFLKTLAPKKWDAAASFFEVTSTIGPELYTEVRGVNAADRLAALLAAHRDPVTFEWSSEASLDIPEQVIPSDVPAWWLLKKKNGMFYNGFGRGDFGRFLMASNLLTVHDTTESAEVDRHMPDVLAYLYSLEPPSYPETVDQSLARKGERIFNRNCAKCHGHYGDNEDYPNLLIPEAVIQTDSFLFSANYSNPQFVEWFNKSWFSSGDHPAKLEPFNGYIAPPLDGVWVTAPYFHNGSVPTIEAVLNSSERPKYWTRDFDKTNYDYTKLGWQYTVKDTASDNKTYNTTLPGYGNQGHYFGDRLSTDERTAVIEYLKTL